MSPRSAFRWGGAYRIYTKDPATDPVNLEPNGARVLRGGKATSRAFYIRSAYRYAYAPGVGYCFRVVMIISQGGKQDFVALAIPARRRIIP